MLASADLFILAPGATEMLGVGSAALRARHPRLGTCDISGYGDSGRLISVSGAPGDPYLQARYGGRAPEGVGLKHPSIAPYGAFTCADGRDIVIAIQNEREWADFWRDALREPAVQ